MQICRVSNILDMLCCAMTFEDQINKLAEEAIACTSEEHAVELIRRMHALMHERLEVLRESLVTVPPVGPVVQSTIKAET